MIKEWFNICKSISVIHHINKMEAENCVISQQMQKSISQIQPPFTIKTFNKVNIEEIYFNTIKVIYNKSILFTNNIQG